MFLAFFAIGAGSQMLAPLLGRSRSRSHPELLVLFAAHFYPRHPLLPFSPDIPLNNSIPRPSEKLIERLFRGAENRRPLVLNLLLVSRSSRVIHLTFTLLSRPRVYI